MRKPAGSARIEAPAAPGIAFLDVPIEWMRFCPTCGRETRHIAYCESAAGLFTVCPDCGDDRLVPFSRATA